MLTKQGPARFACRTRFEHEAPRYRPSAIRPTA